MRQIKKESVTSIYYGMRDKMYHLCWDNDSYTMHMYLRIILYVTYMSIRTLFFIKMIYILR